MSTITIHTDFDSFGASSIVVDTYQADRIKYITCKSKTRGSQYMRYKKHKVINNGGLNDLITNKNFSFKCSFRNLPGSTIDVLAIIQLTENSSMGYIRTTSGDVRIYL